MNVYKQNNEHKVTTLYMLISNFQFIPTDIVSYYKLGIEFNLQLFFQIIINALTIVIN